MMPKQSLNEWALSVGAASARLVVPVLMSVAQSKTVPLQALGERGLPTAGVLCARVVDTNLAAWEPVSAGESLAGLG